MGNRTSEVLTVGGVGTTSTYAYPAGSNKLASSTQAAVPVRGPYVFGASA